MAHTMVPPLFMDVLIATPVIMTLKQPIMMAAVNTLKEAATAMAIPQVITVTVITM